MSTRLAMEPGTKSALHSSAPVRPPAEHVSRSLGSTTILLFGKAARAELRARMSGDEMTMDGSTCWKSASFLVNWKLTWRIPVLERGTSPSLFKADANPFGIGWAARLFIFGVVSFSVGLAALLVAFVGVAARLFFSVGLAALFITFIGVATR